jgi:uncharacterized membrane protein YvbJ
LVTCQACGGTNDEDAEFCAKCGASLHPTTTRKSQRTDCFGGPEAPEDECFGLPYGGAICGIIIGFFIILWASSYFIPQIAILLANWWFLFIGIIGVLMIAGAIYSISRRRK